MIKHTQGILLMIILSMSCTILEARNNLLLGIGAGFTGVGLLTLSAGADQWKQSLKPATVKNDIVTADQNKKTAPLYMLSGLGNLAAGAVVLKFWHGVTT